MFTQVQPAIYGAFPNFMVPLSCKFTLGGTSNEGNRKPRKTMVGCRTQGTNFDPKNFPYSFGILLPVPDRVFYWSISFEHRIMKKPG